MNKREDALDLIRKLFNLGDKERNNSDQEAELAILKAQKLMAKYDISIEEIKEEKEPEYAHEMCEHKWNYGYRVPLAQVLAKNFRCELYERGKSIVFMGRKMDAAICRQTFEFAYKYIMKRGNQEYNRRYEMGYTTRGVFNSYARGFIIGLKKSLDEQCVALAIVTPPDVTAKFKEMSEGWKQKTTKMGEATDAETLQKGIKDGERFLQKNKLPE